MTSSDIINLLASVSASHVMFSLMMRSTALPAFAQIAAQARRFVEAERLLLAHQFVELSRVDP